MFLPNEKGKQDCNMQAELNQKIFKANSIWKLKYLASLFNVKSDVSTLLSFDRVIVEASIKQFFLKVNFVKVPPKRAKKSDITLRMLRNSQQNDFGLLFQKRTH